MSNSISEIKWEFERADQEQLHVLYEKYGEDTRNGVKNLIIRFKKQEEKLNKERQRLEQMREYEKKYAHYTYICGIDEVGRGPLAGPVVGRGSHFAA